MTQQAGCEILLLALCTQPMNRTQITLGLGVGALCNPTS